MPAIVLYFHVHQPYRVRDYNFFDINSKSDYFTNESNRNLQILRKVAEKCYLPTNNLLYELLQKYDDFKISFSISGIVLDQFKEFYPEIIPSFQRLVDTGKVELINETYYHSLSYLKSEPEFIYQIRKHQQTLYDLFHYQTKSFRNTELIYNNDLALLVESLGFDTILAEGVDRYLGWRSPNFVYQPKDSKRIRLLLKNYRLSDDIAFRFSNKSWSDWPLTAPKFANWIGKTNGNGQVINLFMDYETFGEHQWSDTGIFDFLKHLPGEVKKHPDNTFATVSEAAYKFPISDKVDMPDLTSWADSDRDLSAWVENPLQHTALNELYQLEDKVKLTKDDNIIEDWRRLTTSDHLYYMSTKNAEDGSVHQYFSPNQSPFDAYVNYMNVLHDLRQRVYASDIKMKIEE